MIRPSDSPTADTTVELRDHVFWAFYLSGVWTDVNSAAGSMIDVHEADTLTPEQLGAAVPVLLEDAIATARSHDTWDVEIRASRREGSERRLVTAQELAGAIEAVAEAFERGSAEGHDIEIIL